MITGSFIPIGNNSGDLDEKAVKNVFDERVASIQEALGYSNREPEINKEESRKRGKKKASRSWEKVEASKPAEMTNTYSAKSIMPSRAANETNYGGAGQLKGAIASIFNPTASSDVKNDEYTDHVLKAGKKRRKDKEAQKQRNREWEEITPAKSTSDVHPSELGFTPHRTAFSQKPLPKVKVKEIEDQNRREAQSAQAGIEAAKIKESLDNIFATNYEKELSDDRKWEDIELEKINNARNREVEIKQANKLNSSMNYANVLNPNPEKRGDKDISAKLAGVFSMPEDPEKANMEPRMKRQNKTANRRQRREEDRSWESISNAVAKKMGNSKIHKK